MHLFKLTNEQLTQMLLPERFASSSAQLEVENTDCVFKHSDTFEITYKELIEIIGKARLAGAQLLPTNTNH